jgi:hypothetical protein
MKNNFFKTNNNKFFLLICLFFLFALLLRLLSKIYFLTDSYEYIQVAKQIGNFSLIDTKRPFVYPLFLSFFLQFNIVFILIIQTLLGLFTFYFLLKILNFYTIQFQKKHICLLLLTPSIFIYSQLIMSEWLVMLFLTMLFWFLSQKWTKNNFAYIQIITVLLAFTKPIFYPFIYVNLIFFLVYMIKNKVFSFWLFLPIICLQLYLNYNKNVTGYKHFSSIENANLIGYNLYYFKSSTQSKEKAELWLNSVFNDKKYVGKSFKEQNIYLKQIATNEIKKNFFQYSFYHFYTAIRGIVDPGRFDLMTFFEKETGRQGFLEVLNSNKSIWSIFKNKYFFIYIFLLPIFLANCIKWFYFLRYLFFNKSTFKVYYFIILFGYYILVSGPVNCSRYMMPFQGVLMVFAVLGMQFKFNNRNQKI